MGKNTKLQATNGDSRTWRVNSGYDVIMFSFLSFHFFARRVKASGSVMWSVLALLMWSGIIAVWTRDMWVHDMWHFWHFSFAPRLPRKVLLHVAKSHACHAKWASMSSCVRTSCVCVPATQSEVCEQVVCDSRKVKVHVTKCHACHAKSRGAHGDTWDPSAPPEPAQCHKRHACHAKWGSMSPSATPATQSEGPCRQVPGLPRKVSLDVKLCEDKLCVCVTSK